MPNKKKKGFARHNRCSDVKSNRPSKRKLWTEEQMLAAIYSVEEDGLSGNRAADMHGVPRSTLKDRLSGRVVHGVKPGPQPYLSADEERQLAEYLIQASKIGYGKTRLNVGKLIGSSISNGWWQRFLQRNPTITVRSGNNLAGVRMDAVNKENIAAYFNLLRSIHDEHSFENYPECIYNMDETGVPLDPKSPKVIARKGAKKIHCRTSGQKAQITVILVVVVPLVRHCLHLLYLLQNS